MEFFDLAVKNVVYCKVRINRNANFSIS